jgi:hypothetical protein
VIFNVQLILGKRFAKTIIMTLYNVYPPSKASVDLLPNTFIHIFEIRTDLRRSSHREVRYFHEGFPTTVWGVWNTEETTECTFVNWWTNHCRCRCSRNKMASYYFSELILVEDYWRKVCVHTHTHTWGPFGKFVDWRQCAAVMQMEAVTYAKL